MIIDYNKVRVTIFKQSCDEYTRFSNITIVVSCYGNTIGKVQLTRIKDDIFAVSSYSIRSRPDFQELVWTLVLEVANFLDLDGVVTQTLNDDPAFEKYQFFAGNTSVFFVDAVDFSYWFGEDFGTVDAMCFFKENTPILNKVESNGMLEIHRNYED